MESLDDDFIRFLNETDITNDVVAWDGEVIEIQNSDLDFIHSQCSSGPNSQRSFPKSENEAANHVKAIEWESDAISNPSIPFKVITGLKRKAPVVKTENQPKKPRPEDEISQILSQTLKSAIDDTNDTPPIFHKKNEIDQSRLDFNQNSQKHCQKSIIEPQRKSQTSSPQFQHRVCNLIRQTSELRSEIRASLPPTTAIRNSSQRLLSQSTTLMPSISPLSSPTSSLSPQTQVFREVADRPVYPQLGPIDGPPGPADYVKNEPSRSLYSRLQTNFPATDFPKIDRSTNMLNLTTKLEQEKSLSTPPKLTAPPKLTRPPMLTNNSRLGIGDMKGRFEMPTLSKYPKFENRKNDILEKPYIKLEPEDVEIKEPKTEKTYDENQSKSSRIKSQQTIIYEHQKEVSQNIPAKFTPRVPVSVDRLDNMKSRSIDTRTMMSITKEEVEHLILNNFCQPVLNRKNDVGLEFPCKFCNWYHEHYNVPIRSFSRKEEIKRHHMLHLNHDRHTCQLCDYKCVRADHLRRHMRNKHPTVSYCHKTKNIIAYKQDESSFITHS